MVRAICGLVACCLLGLPLVGTPAEAGARAHHRISLHRPVTSELSATLTGRATGRQHVVLQKRRHGHSFKLRSGPRLTTG